jgi:hypothetical protein
MHIEIGEDHLNETGTIRLNPCSLMNNKIAHKNKKNKNEWVETETTAYSAVSRV